MMGTSGEGVDYEPGGLDGSLVAVVDAEDAEYDLNDDQDEEVVACANAGTEDDFILGTAECFPLDQLPPDVVL